MVKHGIIKDDHSGIVVSHDGSRVLWDKDNPRTEIIIKRLHENEPWNQPDDAPDTAQTCIFER